jgi:DHA1 family tetracycline resistance protein-like MFS transporter
MAISIPSPTALVLLQVIPTMSPTWFFVLDAGVGLVNWLSMSFAALSDVMPPRWRTASFGLVFAAFMIGLGVAPSLPLFFSHLAVSILAVSVLFLGFIFAVFFLPETLPSDIALETLERRELTYLNEEDNEPRTYFAQILCRTFREMSILMRSRLILTISVGLFVSAVMYSSEVTLLIYYIEDELNFRDHDIATMLFMNSICGIMIQAFALKFLVDYFGDKNLLMGTFICGTIHNLCFGLAKSKGMIYVALALSQLTKINFSLLTSMGSNTVGVTEQGTMQGALSSLSALANALGPVSLNLIYEHTKDCAYPGPGSMFIFASFLYAAGTLAMSTMPSKSTPIVSSPPLISSIENPHLEPLLQTANLSQDNVILT